MTIELVKNTAKTLNTFLAEIGRPIAYGQALDAVSRLHGHRGWNQYSAVLRRVATQKPLSPSKSLLLASTQCGQFELEVTACLRTTDLHAKASFDAGFWLHSHLSDEDFQDLVEIEGNPMLGADALSQYFKGFNSDVDDVFTYLNLAQKQRDVRNPVGLEIAFEMSDVWAYLRAFRYPLYVRLAFISYFGSLTEAMAAGYGVQGDPDQPGLFFFKAGTDYSDISYQSQEDAWSALGSTLESAENDDAGFVWTRREVLAASGQMRQHCEGANAEPLPVASVEKTQHIGIFLTEGCLSQDILLKLTDNGKTSFSFVLPIDLFGLLDVSGDIDWLNDYVSEQATGCTVGLENISYEVYHGRDWPTELPGSTLLMKVTAYLSSLDWDTD